MEKCHKYKSKSHLRCLGFIQNRKVLEINFKIKGLNKFKIEIKCFQINFQFHNCKLKTLTTLTEEGIQC